MTYLGTYCDVHYDACAGQTEKTVLGQDQLPSENGVTNVACIGDPTFPIMLNGTIVLPPRDLLFRS